MSKEFKGKVLAACAVVVIEGENGTIFSMTRSGGGIKVDKNPWGGCTVDWSRKTVKDYDPVKPEILDDIAELLKGRGEYERIK